MEGALVKGKIVLCDNDDGMYPGTYKRDEVKSLGGIGVVLVDDESRAVAMNYGEFPATAITSKDKTEILSYINSTRFKNMFSFHTQNFFQLVVSLLKLIVSQFQNL